MSAVLVEPLDVFEVPFSSMGMEASIDLGAWAKKPPPPLASYGGWNVNPRPGPS